MTMNVSPAPIVFSYTGSSATVNTNITVTRNPADNSCKDFRLYGTKGGSIDYNRKLNHLGTTLNYNIYKNTALTQILKDMPDVVSTNDYLSASFNGHQPTKTVTIYSNLAATPGGPVQRGGIYSDTISLKLYADVGTWTLSDTYSLNLNTTVPRLVEVSLVDTGAPYNNSDTFQLVDFGELENSESKGFDLKVYSNAGYSLSFSSTNDGKIVNGTSSIDYFISVNGINKDLTHSSSTPVEVANGTGVTPVGGINHTITITIGNVNNKLAGQYNDVITVVATAIE